MTVVTSRFLSTSLSYPLVNGINYIGAHSRNSIHLDEGIYPKFLCILIVENDHVWMRVAEGEVITCGGTPVDNLMVYSGGRSATMQFGDFQLSVVRTRGSYQLMVESRDETAGHTYPAR